MELNTQTVWIEKDVKEGLPKDGIYFCKFRSNDDNIPDWWEGCELRHGYWRHPYSDDFVELISFLSSLTAYVLTEHQMKERGEKLIGEAWDAAIRYHKHGDSHYHQDPPTKSQYIQSIT